MTFSAGFGSGTGISLPLPATDYGTQTQCGTEVWPTSLDAMETLSTLDTAPESNSGSNFVDLDSTVAAFCSTTGKVGPHLSHQSQSKTKTNHHNNSGVAQYVVNKRMVVSEYKKNHENYAQRVYYNISKQHTTEELQQRTQSAQPSTHNSRHRRWKERSTVTQPPRTAPNRTCPMQDELLVPSFVPAFERSTSPELSVEFVSKHTIARIKRQA